ncbi:hypothetical protein AB0J28_04045 [Streptosporangium canum]|uniref:hypothetical protein n=1 Tax=Streptosporangium canum TaxID=324952 RepID=UPI00341DD662
MNEPAGQGLGLAAILDNPVNLRALRRTLAIELAHRPGGVLAAKIHLKHVAVATTEGYAEGRELPQTGEKPQVGGPLRCRSEGRSRGDRPHVTERFSRRESPAETPSHHN